MPDKVTGLYVTAERVTSGLVLKLTPAGRAELEAMTTGDRESGISFDRPHVSAWTCLISDLEECRDIHMLADAEYEMLGALTSAPIIVTLPAYNDQSELTAFDAAFWFPNYQVESELETLLRKGAVTFDLASEPQDLMTCQCGFETFIVEKMHGHKCEGVK